MYCRECGNKLPDGARFCSSCGTPVFADGTHGAFESKEGPAAHSVEPDVSVVGKNGPEIAHEKQEAADESSVARDVSGSFAHQSFTGRLIEFRRTTLKAVPTFVLAVMAFLAAAGTAYAAYRVVKDVIIPAIEQVQGQEEEDSGRQNGSAAIFSGNDSDGKGNEAAHAAYEVVLNDYRDLFAERAGEIDAAGDGGTMMFENGHEFAYTGDFYFYSGKTEIVYSYVDIDGDSVDELLMSLPQEQNIGQVPSFILCGFDYVDGETVRFAESIGRGSYWLRKDYTFGRLGFGGSDTTGFSVSCWNGRELEVNTSVEWSYVDDTDRENPDSVYCMSGIVDGEEIERSLPYASLQSEIDAFCNQYEDYADLNWERLNL